MKRIRISYVLAFALAAPALAQDAGRLQELQLQKLAPKLFGVGAGIASSSTASIDATTANANPAALAKLAKGLRVRAAYAAANLGANIDMIQPWPDDVAPTHL
ncbi:MAG TPA: hypothetical protein VII78_15105, partial [Myxococcota bacterium]